MSFDLNSDFFSRSALIKQGEFTVTGEGQVVILVHFEPNYAEAHFKDVEPPIDSCSFCAADDVSTSLSYAGIGRWSLAIKWRVNSVRKVEYKVKGGSVV